MVGFMADTAQTLAQRLLAGDKRALARAISLVENDKPEGWELVTSVYPNSGRAAIIGFTGPPGVGQSTLISARTKQEREGGQSGGGWRRRRALPFTGRAAGRWIRLSDHFSTRACSSARWPTAWRARRSPARRRCRPRC